MLDRVAHIAVAMLVTICGSNALANSSSMYRYIDDRGVVHFSNAPSDSRYEPIEIRKAPTAASLVSKRKHSVPINYGYDRLILQEAKANRLDPALVKAVIAAESNFVPHAVSRAGAQGLMQLMPRTAEVLGVLDPFEAPQNVSGGTRYLREMLNRYGDLSRALAAYNAGPKAVDHHRGIPPYPETEAYVKRVLAYYRGYQGDFHQ